MELQIISNTKSICNGLLVCASGILLSLAIASIGLGCDSHITPKDPGPPASAKRPHILPIIADTVRADHLGMYGYVRDTTPFLDELSQECLVFERAYSTSCWTLPAHASIFTGLPSSSHGANWEYLKLDDRNVTLAEVLKLRGYATYGFVTNPTVGPRIGFDQGFDTYSLIERKASLGKGKEHPVLTAVRQSIAETAGKPLFLFLNLVEPHAPYNSSEQFFGMYLSDESYRNDVNIDMTESLSAPDEHLNEPRLTHLREHYDAELRYTDSLVSAIIQEFKSAGLWDSTLFVFTSDHGEHHGEHQMIGHQFSLYEPVVHVPLLVRDPFRIETPQRTTAPVQISDLYATILSASGAVTASVPKRSYDLLDYSRIPDNRPLLFEYFRHGIFSGTLNLGPKTTMMIQKIKKYDRRLQAVRVGDFKLIVGDDGSEQLYNLRGDPGERNNLFGTVEYASKSDELLEILEKSIGAFSHKDFETRELTPEDIERLRSVGYL